MFMHLIVPNLSTNYLYIQPFLWMVEENHKMVAVISFRLANDYYPLLYYFYSNKTKPQTS